MKKSKKTTVSAEALAIFRKTREAEAAMITQAMLCQVERGTKNPSLQVSRDIAAVLGCRLDDLLNDC